MSDEHVDELVDLEALGALTRAESARVRAHVRVCPSCRTSLAEAETVAARIALSTPLRRAPAELRARVLRQVILPAQPAPAVPSTPSARRPRLLRFATRWGALAAALLVVPVAGLLTWAALLQSQVNDLKEDNRQMQETQRDLVLLAYPTAIKARLTPTEHADTARGYVNWNPDQGRCAVFVSGLAKAEHGVSYRVFYQAGPNLREAGELKPDDDGVAELRFDVRNWRGNEYPIWVAAVRPDMDQHTVLLRATLRRE